VPLFGDSKLSDAQGSVNFEDPLARKHVHLTLQSTRSTDPIAQIELQFISDGHEYLIAALDPTEKFAPQLISGTYQVTSDSSPDKGVLAIGLGRADAAQSGQEGWQELNLVMKILEGLDRISTVKDLAVLLRGLPSLEKWSGSYADTCWTGKQMATAVNVASGVVGIVLPLDGAALTSTVGSPEAGLMLAAMVAVSLHTATEDANAYLSSLPGTYRLRFYYFPSPITFLAVQYLGECSTPTSSPSATVTSSPTLEGFVNLVGRWSGKVSGNSEGSISQYDETVVIAADCQSGPLCLTYPNNNDPAFVDIPLDFEISTLNHYCFTKIVTFSQTMSLSYQACFSVRADGRLDYEFGGPLFGASGLLQRVKSEPEPTSPAFHDQTEQPGTRISDIAFCPQLCNGSNAVSSLPEGTTRIYAQWSYSNVPVGASYVRTWSMNRQEWVRYSCAWPGPATGIDMVTLTEPGGLHSGTWELMISVNGNVVARQQIQVEGQGSYWSPAGSFDSCYGKK
jgi:hypothetical protein